MKQRKPAALALAGAATLAALALFTPAHATDAEGPAFKALQSVEAERLSPAQMQAITGRDGTSIAAVLAAAASTTTSPTYASSLTTLAAAYSQITVSTSRLFINRVLVRR